jgi:hypothetical protein
MASIGVPFFRRTAGAALAAVVAASLTVVGDAAPAVAAPTPPPTCAPEQADPTVAERMVEACGRRVEILSERTEYSQVFANGDGTRTIEQSVEPQRVRRGSGWVPVDTSLKQTADGVAPRATVLPMMFSNGGDTLIGKLGDGANELTLSWVDKLPKPDLKGDTAVYRNVLPDVDLRVTATATGFSEVFVVHTPKAAEHSKLVSLKFGVTTKGVTLHKTPAGGLRAVDKQGNEVFTAPVPLMWDSSVSEEAKAEAEVEQRGAVPHKSEFPESVTSADENLRRAVMPVTVEAKAITLTPDRAMLRDPRTKYPVYIDPLVSGGISGNAWTSVWSKYPTKSFWKDTSALTNGGTYGSAGVGRTEDCSGCADHKIRSFFRMDTSKVKSDDTVISATFTIEQRWSWTCSPASNAKVWKTGGIGASTTWNKQPTWNNSLTAQSKANRKYGAVHGCIGPGLAAFDVSKMVVSGASTVTLGLKAIDEGTKNQWKRFKPSTAKLSVKINKRPHALKNMASHGEDCASGDDRPYVLHANGVKLGGTQSDPNTDQSELTTTFYWWKKDGGSRNETDKVSQKSGNPGTVTGTIPNGKLVDGQIYKWRAVTTDNQIPNSTADETWSAECEFIVDATNPEPPSSITSTDYSATEPRDGVGVAGKFKIGRPLTKWDEVVAYGYSLTAGEFLNTPTVPVLADRSGTVTVVPRTDGQNTLEVWSIDRAGRKSTSKTFTFTVKIGSGPRAEWNFNEAAGTTTAGDLSRNGNTLTLAGGATRVAGRGGVPSALQLNGTTGAATKSSAISYLHNGVTTPMRTDSDFTVTARVKLDAIGGTAQQVAIAASGSRTSAYTLGFNNTDNKWRFAMAGSDADNAATVQVVSNAVATANKWTHLAGVYDAQSKKLTLYVNGALQSSTATLTGGFNATGVVSVGKRKWNGVDNGFLKGAIDDVRVYSFIEPAAKIGDLAKPLRPLVTFENGPKVANGGTLKVKFDAAGDTNVTRFRYSLGDSSLTSIVNATSVGGAVTATVTINVGTQAGERPLYAAADDGVRYGLAEEKAFTVAPGKPFHGRAHDRGLGVAGMTVTLQPGGYSTTTGTDGEFAFPVTLPHATYRAFATDGTRCGMAGNNEHKVDGQGFGLDLYVSMKKDIIGHLCSVRSTTFAAANTVLPLTGDDATAAIDLPFAFPFYGDSYNSVWVDTNGVLSFTEPGRSLPYPGSGTLRSAAASNAVIAPFWDDLVVDAQASVRTSVSGAGGTERMLIEWRNVHRKGNTAQRLSFEATLAADGSVTTNYDALDNAAEQGDNAVVGIEGPDGSDGFAYSTGEPVLASGTAIVFTRPDGELLEVHDLTGKLTNAAGAPVAAATVTLDPGGLSTKTAANGTYSFLGVIADSYTVASRLDGRCAAKAEAQLDLFANATQDLQLAPDYGPMGYACTVGASTYTPADTGLELFGDSSQRKIDLPFDVSFYGRTSNVAEVGTDGWVTLDGGHLDVFWGDLNIDGSASMWSRTAGAAPNRSFTIEWRNALIAGSADRTTFQVVLHEDGRVVYQYGAMSTDRQKGSTVTIGLETKSLRLTDFYSAEEAALTANSSITYTPAGAGEVHGMLTAADSAEPISGATITLSPGGQSITTDWDGSYRFLDIPIGEHVVSVDTGDDRCHGQYASEIVHKSLENLQVDLSTDGDPFYGCTNEQQPFIDADTVQDWTGDDEMWTVNPPFPVSFYGESHTSAWISSNGVVAFKPTSRTIDSHPGPIPAPADPVETPADPDNAVYPFWNDWVVDDQAAIATGVAGTAPNRRWIVEWRNVRHYDDESVRVSFEAVFNEAGGITFNYDGVNPDNAIERGATGTVGVEDSSGTTGFEYLYQSEKLADGRSITFAPTSVEQNSITGTLTCFGEPVEGATVSAAGQTAITEADGTYRLDEIPVRTWAVVATVATGPCQGSWVEHALVGRLPAVVPFMVETPEKGPEYTNTITEVQASYVPVGDTSILPLDEGQTATNVDLPFTITLYGAGFDQMVVWADGSFGRDSGYVCPLMDDWIIDGDASVRTEARGSGTSRQFVIEWHNVRHRADPQVRTTFQAIIDETGGFTFVYPENDGTFLQRGGNATIGAFGSPGEANTPYGLKQPVLRQGYGLRLESNVP